MGSGDHVIISAIDRCFVLVDTGQKGLKRNATLGREREAFVIIIPTMHGTSFYRVSKKCVHNLIYKKFPLHNLLEVNIWSTQKEGFVTPVELEQVFEMFTVNIQALLNLVHE
jgi:hypothetical protein